jgi:hypothetical protein
MRNVFNVEVNKNEYACVSHAKGNMSKKCLRISRDNIKFFNCQHEKN